MRFALDRPVKVVMLGAGGTGGHIAPHLYRLLHALDRPVKVIIADGDIVEEKNLVRQNFIAADLGRNKAQVLAERYASAFGIEAQYIPEFIECEERLSGRFTLMYWIRPINSPRNCHAQKRLCLLPRALRRMSWRLRLSWHTSITFLFWAASR